MAKLIKNKSDLDALTQLEARDWLITNDREGAKFWRSLPLDTDFVLCVRDDIEGFGYQ